MDEKVFIEKWRAATGAAHFEVGDVREAVWERIAEAQPADDLPVRGGLLRLDVAAAVIIAVGSGLFYSVLSDFNNAVFWHGPLHTLIHSYF